VDNEKTAQTLSAVEAEIKEDTGHEEGVIVGRDGEIVWRGGGGGQSVNPPAEKVKGNIFTHNHPSGGCAFSINDIERFITDDGYEVRAVTRDGRFVSIKKGMGEVNREIAHDMRIAGLTFSDAVSVAEDKVIEKYGRDAYISMSRTMRTQVIVPYIEEMVNSWMRKNASKYGYVFTEGLI